VAWALDIQVKLVTTKPENNAFGKVSFMQDKLDFSSELREEIAMYLGGMVAEEMAFGEHTYGCHQDVKDAIDLAKKYLSRYAMGERFIYKNSLGTDFSVGMPENYIFCGGAELERMLGELKIEANKLMPDSPLKPEDLVIAGPGANDGRLAGFVGQGGKLLGGSVM